MKRKANILAVLIIAAVIMTIGSANAQKEEGGDKTLSPFFFVQGDSQYLDHFALKSTVVDVNVAGTIADVTVSQVYKNNGTKPIEAIYIFPASTRAAVYGMKMTIGTRTITANIRKREEARQEYEKAKSEGKSASLLEQQRPNVFQMNVANILPQDVIKVELKYTEHILPTSGVYEFVYPTVVGPRYSNQPAANAPDTEKWVSNPYLHEGQQSPTTLDINTKISAGMPVREVSSSSHKVNISYDSPTVATVKLDSSEKYAGNKDFIVKYRLSGGKIESGLLLYDDGHEKFFMMMVEPPERVTTDQIPPREYIFVVDVSGSMYGFPLEMSKKLVKNLLSGLRTKDTFNVILFSGGSTIMAERSVHATPENVQQATALIDRQSGGGGTELLPAMKRALSMPGDEKTSRTIVVITDGYVTVEKEVFELIRNSAGKFNVFAFGVGTNVNRFIIEGMARVGMGEPFIVTNPGEVTADKFRQLISTPVLTDIKVDFGHFRITDVEPPAIPDVFAERPLVIFGKWSGTPEGTITVKGVTGERQFVQKIEVSKAKPSNTNSAIKYLWARQRVALLADYNKLRPDSELVKEVTDLGLKYSLLTDYTSFVAVDSLVRLKDGKAETVVQPLPLPEGVSDYAVGGQASGHTRLYKAARKPMPNIPAAPAVAPESAVEGEMVGMTKDGSYGTTDTVAQNGKEQRDLKQSELKKVKTNVEIVSITTTQDIDKTAVENVIKSGLPAFNRCCHAKPGEKIKFTKLTLRFTIDYRGKAANVRIVNGSSGQYSKCLIEALKGLIFPSLKEGGTITITLSAKILR
ncbi:MAG: VWA domain-containing protein [Nitrospirae bacterium]|nr:VWA domain-containing protein [Nitrospirota bacterium]